MRQREHITMAQQQEAPQGTPPPPGDEEPEFDFEGAFERLAGEKCRCAPGCAKAALLQAFL